MAAVEGEVIGCHTIEQWTHNLDAAKTAHKLVVVDFTATWCPPCRSIAPFIDECAKKYPNVLFLKVDVDEMKEVTEEWEVNAMPTFIFMKDGEKVETLVGPGKPALTASIEKHSATTSA